VTQANDIPSETATPGAATENKLTGVSLGEKLRAAREQRSLSIEQVSEALHLDEPIIAALEQGQYETLGAPVYIRGHLKTYAQLLGLSPEVIASEYQCDAPESAVTQTLQQPAVVSISVNPVLWAGGALAILLGLSLGFYVMLGNDDGSEQPIVVAESIEPQAAAVPVQAEPQAVELVETAIEAPALAADRPDTPPADRRDSVAALQVATKSPLPAVSTEIEDNDLELVPRPAATMRLGLQFSQESWVEISDANRRLLFGLQHEGNRREVTGEPPFNLLIGNAHGVTLTINDEPFDVPATRVRGKVARFEITGADLSKAE